MYRVRPPSGVRAGLGAARRSARFSFVKPASRVRPVNRAQAAIGAWLAVGAVAFALLPWYLSAAKTLLQSLPGVFGGADTASGLVQAALHGKWWLWTALAAFMVAAFGWRRPAGRAQGRVLVAGACIGLVGLLATGFAIGIEITSLPLTHNRIRAMLRDKGVAAR